MSVYLLGSLKCFKKVSKWLKEEICLKKDMQFIIDYLAKLNSAIVNNYASLILT